MGHDLESNIVRENFEGYGVLLVEDDEIMRLSLEDRLQLDGIPVRAVGDLGGARK